jgi:hypothetical protein
VSARGSSADEQQAEAVVTTACVRRPAAERRTPCRQPTHDFRHQLELGLSWVSPRPALPRGAGWLAGDQAGLWLRSLHFSLPPPRAAGERFPLTTVAHAAAQVERRKRQLEQARKELVAAIRVAHETGEATAVIADVAGLGRRRISQLLRERRAK